MAERALRGWRGNAAFEPHLKLLGALGRLWAVTGRPELALQTAGEAAHGFLDRQAFDEISYPLSEWYRLAGALTDRAAFAEAEAMRDTVEGRGGLGLDGNAYVTLSRARARMSSASVDDARRKILARSAQGVSCTGTFARPPPAGSPRCTARGGRTEAEAQTRSELAEAARAEAALPKAAGDRVDSCSRFRSSGGPGPRAVGAIPWARQSRLTNLGRLERGLVANLSPWFPRRELPAYVARFHPY